MTVALAVTIGVLYGTGVWLLLQRSLSRIVIGLAVLGHGANLLLLAAGGPGGDPPIAGSDPALTADVREDTEAWLRELGCRPLR